MTTSRMRTSRKPLAISALVGRVTVVFAAACTGRASPEPISVSSVRDAPPGDGTFLWPSSDAGTTPPASERPSAPSPELEPLPTRLLLENGSGETIYLTAPDCCEVPTFAGAYPMVPPTSLVPGELVVGATTEGGCTCECEKLAPGQTCAASFGTSFCTAMLETTELADGDAAAVVVSATRYAYFDDTRKCLGLSGYEPGQPFMARFCWRTRHATVPSCDDVRFAYGAEEVHFVVPRPDKADGAQVSQDDAGFDDDAGLF